MNNQKESDKKYKELLKKKVADTFNHPKLVGMVGESRAVMEYLLRTSDCILEKIFNQKEIELLPSQENTPSKTDSGKIRRIQKKIDKKFQKKINKMEKSVIFTTELDAKNFLVYGDCQSGKTHIILSISVAHMFYNQASMLVVLDNSISGAKQIKARAKSFSDSLKEYLKERGFKASQLVLSIYAGNATDEQLRDALTGKTPRPIVTGKRRSF